MTGVPQRSQWRSSPQTCSRASVVLQLRAEVHRRHLAIGQPVLEELQEEPLRPLVVFRVAGDGFALPVEHRAHRAHLLAHLRRCSATVHVFGMDVALDRGVFGGQTKRVKAHREQHVIAAHPHPARARIRGRHRVPVPDVQVAAGIGQHGQRVELGPRRIDHRAIQPVALPLFRPNAASISCGTYLSAIVVFLAPCGGKCLSG